MPKLPYLRPTARTRRVTDSFLGYDRRQRIPEGAFHDMENLSSRAAPLLATRPARGLLRTLAAPGGLAAKDSLAWVESGTLYCNGLPTGLNGLRPGTKQLVSMGAYLLVFPDKCYLNTADLSDFGSMEAHWRYSGPVSLSPCRADGTALPDAVSAAEEPEQPQNGQLWLDTGSGRLLQYAAATLSWVELESPCTRLRFTTRGQLPALFSRYDGVTLSGAGALDGEKILYEVVGGEDGDSLVVVGLTPAARQVEQAQIELSRSVPDMDYVCQCGNRLWGCFYGSRNGQTVNEIYASALGDFRNFHQFLGLATDSWAASVGSDGVFTGAVSYLDSPVFFKEEIIHRVTLSAEGAHRLSDTPCRGVQQGSAGSLQVVGETLYYLARDGLCAWQGGFPQAVSRALGDLSLRAGRAGALGERYYLSALDGGGAPQLLVYDTALQLWHREDGFRAQAFAAAGGELYALEEGTGRLWAMTGRAGTPEAPLRWRLETGLLSYGWPGEKTVSRYHLRLSLEPGQSATAWIEYDSSGVWLESGTITAPAGEGARVFPVTLPVRPRRCDHLRLRLTGTGQLRLHAISRLLERGSDALGPGA